MDHPKKKILISGASGYIAPHLIKMLLENGHKVRGTVRSLAKKDKYEFLYSLCPDMNKHLELVEADLSDKESWLKACEGCDYVFHMASPFPSGNPKDENEVIQPAVEGTLNVLEAAAAKGVKKVVVTSSGFSIFFGNADKLCTEEDWGKEEISPPYPKSKIKAEKAAWKFYEENADKIEMVVVCPSMVLGPILAKHGGATEVLVAEIMNGNYPGIIDVGYSVVDVRDVAKGHYKAMFTEGTNGKRFALCHTGTLTMEHIINTLKGEFGKLGYDIKDKKITADEAKASGNEAVSRHIPMIGKKIAVSNERSMTGLGMDYIPVDKMIIDMGHSLIQHGVVEDKTKGR